MDTETLDRLIREALEGAGDVAWTVRQNGRDAIADLSIAPTGDRKATIEAWGEVSHLRFDEGVTFTLIEYDDEYIAENVRQLATLGADYLRGAGSIESRRGFFGRRRPVLTIESGGYAYEISQRWSKYGELS